MRLMTLLTQWTSPVLRAAVLHMHVAAAALKRRNHFVDSVQDLHSQAGWGRSSARLKD